MGNLLCLNFGTFAETNRFKALAIQNKFLTRDLMDSVSPGELVRTGGIRQVLKRGGTDMYSFYRLTSKVWRSKLSDGNTSFSDAFKKWMDRILKQPVHCAYLTGHHWDDHNSHRYMYLSWGEDTSYFHARIDTTAQGLVFGASSNQIAVAIKNALAGCKLALGFGCNVATGINSEKYRKFFGGTAIVLGWTQSVSVPTSKQSDSVNARFFGYLENYAKQNTGVPAQDRLNWFYQKQPMELVRAWGYATIFWYSKQARARDQQGKFYRFNVDKKKQTAVPVSA